MQDDITLPQLSCIKAIMGKLKFVGDIGEAMVEGFSSKGSSHVSDLYKVEAIAMIQYLKAMDPDEAKAEIMRRKIIAMAYEVAGVPKGAAKADKQAVVLDLDNNWMMTYSYLKKKLNRYTYKELPLLVTQYEKRYKSLLKAL